MMVAHTSDCHSAGDVAWCHVDHNLTGAGEPQSSFLLRIKHAKRERFTQVTSRAHL